MITRVKGTQDFLDLTLYNFLIERTKNHLALYNFIEIATPILEHTELFRRSLGLETDVVSKEMYTIAQDDEESLCLRPEATASVVRAFINNGIQQTPWKVYLWGPMFRHERPQKGRFRQFHQVSIEIIGSQSIYQDVHFLKMLDRFFSETLKLDTYGLLINFLGCSDDRTAYKQKLHDFLEKNASAVCATCIIRKEKNVMRVFDCKNVECQPVYKTAPRIADNLCAPCAAEWQQLRDNLEHLSISYSYTPSLVRGLDYYDKTVFEFVSSELGAQNAFCGGGRYNTLVKELGGKEEQQSLGASLGMERIVLLLERIKDKLMLPVMPALYVILPLTPEQQPLALLLADELQARDLCTDILLDEASLKSMMRTANKMGAKFALIIGPDEQKEKMVMVKNMITGADEKVPQRDVANYLTR